MSIRFLGEWDKYPAAIADVTTKNESFMYLVKIYKAMGISNYAFPLALHRPWLQGVNPHSETLDKQTELDILQECRENLWYYLREVQLVPVPGSPKASVYLANRANIAMSWSLLVGIDIVIIMPRQCGKSVGADCIMTWVINIAARSTTCQLITKDAKLRKANIKRLKKFREVLPKYLYSLDPIKDSDNTEEITNIKLDNYYVTAVGRADPDAADNVGRGLTGPLLQGDEVPYIPNIHISLPVAMSAATAARTFAMENGTLFGNLFTTTAGKLDTVEGAYAFKLFNSGTWWSEKYLDCINYTDLVETIRANSNGDRLIFNGTFSHLQLGKTNKWLKEAIINAGGTRESAIRDYLNGWTSANDVSPLDAKVYDAISMAGRKPSYVERTDNKYHIRWHCTEKELPLVLSNAPILLSLDSSDAVGRDANGITFSDLRSMQVIGAADIKEANLYRMAMWIADLLIAFPNMTFMFENKSSGKSICDMVSTRLMIAGINPFKRIFNSVVNERSKNQELYDKIITRDKGLDEDVYVANKSLLGFNTTGKTRALLYDQVLFRAANSVGHRVNDEQLVKQITALVEINNRIDHPIGGHDDLVISWLLANWFATMAQNVSAYGIRPGIMYSLVVEDQTSGGRVEDESDTDAANELSLKQMLMAIQQQMERTSNPMMLAVLAKRANVLLSSIKDVSKRSRIMDELKTEIVAKKRRGHEVW